MRSTTKFACAWGLGLVVSISFGAEADAIKTVTAAGGKLQYDVVAKKRLVGGATLSGQKVTDATMKDLLEFPALTRVMLKNAPKVTADGVKELSKVKQLQTVELAGPIVTDDIAKALASATTITELRLEEGALTDDGVKELAALTKLHTLGLTKNKKVKGTTVPALVAVKNLKYLTVSNCDLGDLAGWAALKSLASLNTLSLTQSGVNDDGLKELGKLTQLKSLNLESSPISDAGLAELKGLKSLESLNVVGTKLTEKAVPILSELKRLEFLTISEKQIGKAGVEALKKALPKCDVNALP